MEEATALADAKRDHSRSQKISINALEQKQGFHHSSPLIQSTERNCGKNDCKSTDNSEKIIV